MEITLCMIIKNEELLLEDLLLTIVSQVDEIIIVDTGSTDNSVKIAREYTDQVYSFESTPFSYPEARNYAISKATKDWILFLDADERLICQENWSLKKIIQDNSENDIFLVWRYELFPGHTWTGRTIWRIFKRDKLKFTGDVFEFPLYSNREAKFICPTHVYINHLQYLKADNVIYQKKKKYLEMLEFQVKSKGIKISLTNLLFACLIMIEIGETEKMLRILANIGSTYKDFIWIDRIFIGEIYRNLHRYDESIESYQHALELAPDVPSIASTYDLIGSCYLYSRNAQKAYDSFSHSFRLDSSLPHRLINLGLANFLIGNTVDAGILIQKGLEQNKMFSLCINDDTRYKNFTFNSNIPDNYLEILKKFEKE